MRISTITKDFDKDLNHFRYIKRLLKKCKISGDLKVQLLINHFIICIISLVKRHSHVVFKIEKHLWSSVKTFVVFLDRLPGIHTYIHDIDIDENIFQELEGMSDGEG